VPSIWSILSCLTPSTKGYPDRTLALGLGALGCAMGTWATLFYARAGLTLSHYDAKAHLVVARRVFDSLTPGWVQIGAVWLPFPHLLNALPVQIDTFYRTGASAVVLSGLAFALACYAAARLVLNVTGSQLGAVTAVAALALEPNLLYLQATPMTEPLLLGLTLLAVALVYEWIERDGDGAPSLAGWTLAAACLTRYESWFVMAALLIGGWFALWRRGHSAVQALKIAWRLARYPAGAIAAFLVYSRISTGEWFVTSGFFVPDNTALGRPLAAIAELEWGTRTLAGPALVRIAVLGAVVTLIVGAVSRRRVEALLALSTVALGVLPVCAFAEGHPFRIRYMVPMVAAVAIFTGIGVGWTRGWWRRLAAGAVAALLALTAHPFDRSAPVVVEAQSDRANSEARRIVTGCLVHGYHGEPILASMGSLAHYMQELSQAGFAIRDFVHEGNDQLWRGALNRPEGHVGWILIEEQAEGGDMLAARARARPDFLFSFHRLCEGGGVALYEADHKPPLVN
jgi:hypothetical protein